MKSVLFDSEWKLMELIWENEPVSAKQLALLATDMIGWNKNTTYTVLKKLVEKEYVSRKEPGFICEALIKKEQVQKAEAQSLVKRFFNGSKKALFSALLEDETLSEEEIDALRRIIEKR